MITDSAAPVVQQLTTDECWVLLQEHQLARLAVSVLDRPEIFPVNYVVQDGTLLFRTAPGTKLATLTVNRIVAMEIDGHGADDGWSVLVKGQAEAFEWGAQIRRAEAAPLRPWIPTDKPVYVRVTPAEVTGRHFRFGDPEPS